MKLSPSGARGAQEVAVHHVERRGAHVAHERGRHDDGDGADRQDHRPDRLGGLGIAAQREAPRRQPAQRQRELVDEQDAEPEDRDGDPHLRDDRQREPVPAVRLDRRQDPERHRDEDRQQEGGEGQGQGDAEARADLLDHRRARDEALAEVEPREVAEVAHELRRASGWSEPICARAAAICSGVAPTPTSARRGIAGQEPQEHEEHHRRDDERQEQDAEPAQHVGQHRLAPSRRPARRPTQPDFLMPCGEELRVEPVQRVAG